MGQKNPYEVATYIVENQLQHLLQERGWGRKSVKEQVNSLTKKSDDEKVS